MDPAPAPGSPTPGAVHRCTPPLNSTRRRIAHAALRHRRSARLRRAPIRVTVGEIEEVGRRHPHHAELRAAASARRRLGAHVRRRRRSRAACRASSLDGPPQGDKVAGRLEAKIGPIAASFAGEGTIRQIPAEYRQVIEGRGGDRKSGSRASGSVDYRLSALTGEAGGEATRVDVVISYALTGALAQIGRSGLVRDLVRRIGEAFAQNLDAQLRDPTAEMAQAQLGGLSLLMQVIWDRVREWFVSVFPKRP